MKGISMSESLTIQTDKKPVEIKLNFPIIKATIIFWMPLWIAGWLFTMGRVPGWEIYPIAPNLWQQFANIFFSYLLWPMILGYSGK